MATTYHDWASQATDALKLTRLELFLGELQALSAGKSVAGDGFSKSENVRLPDIEVLLAERDRLQRRVSLGSGDRVSHMRKARPR